MDLNTEHSEYFNEWMAYVDKFDDIAVAQILKVENGGTIEITLMANSIALDSGVNHIDSEERLYKLFFESSIRRIHEKVVATFRRRINAKYQSSVDEEYNTNPIKRFRELGGLLFEYINDSYYFEKYPKQVVFGTLFKMITYGRTGTEGIVVGEVNLENLIKIGNLPAAAVDITVNVDWKRIEMQLFEE